MSHFILHKVYSSSEVIVLNQSKFGPDQHLDTLQADRQTLISCSDSKHWIVCLIFIHPLRKECGRLSSQI